MSYLVQYTNGGEDFFLLSTVFTFLQRATRFETEEEAKKALYKAAQFMQKKAVKICKIVKEEEIVFASDKSAEYHKIIPSFV